MLEKISNYRNVPVSIAAEILDVSQNYIRAGLRSNRLPIGSAVQISDNKWTYQISPGLLTEYVTGSKSLKQYFEDNKEILKKILE